jgi:hypothetical protein
MLQSKKIIVEFIGAIIRKGGLFHLFNRILRRKVTILIYHRPNLKLFQAHVRFLSKNFNFIELKRLISAIEDKDWSKIPQNALIVTIDDGFRENYQLLEFLREIKLRPTIYLCSHIVNTMRHFWFNYGKVDPRKYFKLDQGQRLSELLFQHGFDPQREYSSRQALNLEEINQMASFVDFQSHSRFHPILPKCSEEELKAEIWESKRLLEKILGWKIFHFSYPNGDFNQRAIDQLKSAGYRSARTCDVGWNDVNSDPYRLKAMGISDDASLNQFVLQLYGIAGFIRFVKSGSISGKHPEFT